MCLQTMKNRCFLVTALLASVGFYACSGESVSGSGERDDAEASDTGPTDADEVAWVSSGLEIIEGDNGRGWMALDMTPEAFETIVLADGWRRNPRDLEFDVGEFFRSPDASTDGTFTDAHHFGYMWRHVVNFDDTLTPLDDAGLLNVTTVDKFHRVTFETGRTLTALRAPGGETYLRISRDPARTTDTVSLPEDWQLIEHTTAETIRVSLSPGLTLIRSQNQDVFQGPLPSDLAALF